MLYYSILITVLVSDTLLSISRQIETISTLCTVNYTEVLGKKYILKHQRWHTSFYMLMTASKILPPLPYRLSPGVKGGKSDMRGIKL